MKLIENGESILGQGLKYSVHCIVSKILELSLRESITELLVLNKASSIYDSKECPKTINFLYLPITLLTIVTSLCDTFLLSLDDV